ncbi:MAG: hypothetical protein U1F20_00130 [Lysobacterales bacterium]
MLEKLRASGKLDQPEDYRNLYAMYLNHDKNKEGIAVIQEGLQKGVEGGLRHHEFPCAGLLVLGPARPGHRRLPQGRAAGANGETYRIWPGPCSTRGIRPRPGRRPSKPSTRVRTRGCEEDPQCREMKPGIGVAASGISL